MGSILLEDLSPKSQGHCRKVERMTSWQIYRGPDGSVEPIKEGFNFGAFIFHGLWALSHRLYMYGAIGVGGLLTVAFLYKDQSAVAVILVFALMLVFGTLGNTWRIGHLMRSGYRHLGTLKAANKKAAEQEARDFYSELQTKSSPTT